jgi:hypothetical protein
MKRKAWSMEHRVKRQRSEVGSRRSEGIKKGPGVGDQGSEVRRLRKARIKLIALRKGVEIVEILWLLGGVLGPVG